MPVFASCALQYNDGLGGGRRCGVETLVAQQQAPEPLGWPRVGTAAMPRPWDVEGSRPQRRSGLGVPGLWGTRRRSGIPIRAKCSGTKGAAGTTSLISGSAMRREYTCQQERGWRGEYGGNNQFGGGGGGIRASLRHLAPNHIQFMGRDFSRAHAFSNGWCPVHTTNTPTPTTTTLPQGTPPQNTAKRAKPAAPNGKSTPSLFVPPPHHPPTNDQDNFAIVLR